MLFPILHIVHGSHPDHHDLLGTEGFESFGRYACIEKSGLKLPAFRNQSTCCDYAMFGNHRFIQYDRPHSNEYFIFNGTTMQDHPMTDDDIIAYPAGSPTCGTMQDCRILDVCPFRR